MRAKYDDATKDRVVAQLQDILPGCEGPVQDLLREVIDKVESRRCVIKRRDEGDDGGPRVSVVTLRNRIPEDW